MQMKICIYQLSINTKTILLNVSRSVPLFPVHTPVGVNVSQRASGMTCASLLSSGPSLAPTSHWQESHRYLQSTYGITGYLMKMTDLATKDEEREKILLTPAAPQSNAFQAGAIGPQHSFMCGSR